MKKINLIVMGIMLLILLNSCTTVRHSMIMPEYKNSPVIKNKTLAVYFDYSSLAIGNESSLVDDLGEGVPKDIFKDFFTRSVTTNIQNLSYFSRVEPAQFINTNDMETTQLKVSDKIYMKFDLPTEENIFQFDSIQPDFVLLIKDIFVGERFETSTNYSPPNSGGVTTSSTKRYLDINCEYLIWDNTAMRIVAYGKGRSSNKVFIKMNMKTWENAVKDFSRFLLKKTPFVKNGAVRR